MPAVTITVEDLEPFATIEPVKAQAMIDDALAMAARFAPCLSEPAFLYPEAARALLRGAILRWNDSGSGSAVQMGAGPFQVTNPQRKSMFWPSEITDLQKLCSSGGKAFMVDQVPPAVPSFADRPDLWFQWVFPVPPGAP